MIITVFPCEYAFEGQKKYEQDMLSMQIQQLLLASLPPAIAQFIPKISEANLSNYFNKQFTKRITLADYNPNESILVLSEEPTRKFLSFFNRSPAGIYVSAALTAETEYAENDSPDFLYFIPPGEIVTVSTAVPITPLSIIFDSQQIPTPGYLIIGIGYLDSTNPNDNTTQYP